MAKLLDYKCVYSEFKGLLKIDPDKYGRDLLPPLKEVGASCSMALSGQVSTGYPRRPGGSSFITISSYVLPRFSFSNLRPSSRMFFAALISRSWN